MKPKPLTAEERKRLVLDLWFKLRIRAIFGKVLQPGDLPEVEQPGYKVNGDGQGFYRDKELNNAKRQTNQ